MWIKALLIIAVICNVLAQVALRTAMKHKATAGITLVGHVMLYLGNPLFWSAVGLYGLGFILYALVLSKMDLSQAYPISSMLALVLTVTVAVTFMNEPLTATKTVGLALCLLGIAIIFR
mgnify:CR=1 FL=1